ncbi:hypothetical protein, partial [Burkholderia gladioli]|uniref:hypothetical protein n=1 Tax=Burkholderia gladioli TaxID=28095 RepID=UPI003C7B378F
MTRVFASGANRVFMLASQASAVAAGVPAAGAALLGPSSWQPDNAAAPIADAASARPTRRSTRPRPVL